MPDDFFNVPPKPPGAESLPSISPPPLEVKIRTLQSDLESMAASGGGSPKFETVKFGTPAKVAPAPAGAPPVSVKRSNLLIAMVIVAAVLIVAAVVYMAYQIFLKQSVPANQMPTPATPLPAANSSAATESVAPPVSVSLAPANFAHKSLFQKPADQVLTFIPPSASASSAAELVTFNQKLSTLLKTVSPTPTLLEVVVTDANGAALAVSDIWASAGTDVIDPGVIAAHFNPDATFFVYRDKNGFWPGYVLTLKSGENWLFVKPQTATLENSAKVANFFLTNVGTPAVSGFQDSTLGSQPVRVLNFSAPSSTFVYGWFNGNLVLSTSLDGLKEALTRLGIKI